ncbi:hypothetical protein CTI12_AA066110 [Artemisia annua]|uniref:Coactivator CBP, KIX domain-containing protein n=1 Tax=Artemisia annua TaxID=35608 RepID=A0A2U1PPY3_ARTAN|nr:hypothetical protein CTI12_AA066110 [Artemisia annua]
MPRHVPISYECVRRSWHCDGHQPIRGSIIQQIFRVVQENHSTFIKKNEEWQQKLPLLVLKLEEIMYSKANYEAEYLNPETLWERVNDGINTIIRKDESMEAREFLLPCVEAALNLGCVPARRSRSQRCINTKSCVSQLRQDRVSNNAINLNSPNHKRPNDVNQKHIVKTNRDVRPHHHKAPPSSSIYPSSIENFPKQSVSIVNKASLAASSVYPLYYGLHFQPQNSNTVIVGKPVFQTLHEPLSPPFISFSDSLHGSKNAIHEEPKECDLALRLGLVSNSQKDFTSINDSHSMSGQNKEFLFFPLNSDGEQAENLVADVRKRKAVSVNTTVDGAQTLLLLGPNLSKKGRVF